MKLVFDTSSLSHAFEDLTHAIYSAAQYCKNKPRCDIKRFLERRFKSEYESKELLLSCDTNVCMIPTDIRDELMRNPQMRDELEIFTKGGTVEIVRRYKSSSGILSRLFRSRLKVESVRPSYYYEVKEMAKKLGINVSWQDMKAIALALQTNSTLVTADRNMEKLAKALGVKVIFTIPKI